MSVPMFVPPRKPVPLLQELYWPDAWAVFVCCAFLNCTQRKQVDQVVGPFFKRYPDPHTYIEAFENQRQGIIDTIRPLGFYNRRSERLYRLSKDYITKAWSDPRGLYGVGEYGARCYEILFEGRFGDSPPDDHALADYWHFYMETHAKLR